MQFLKISDFCRKYKLAPHRFTRYKRLFHTQPMEGYKVPWVKVDEWNLAIVKNILEHTGTRRQKERLTLDEFCRKHHITDHYFPKVCHRMNLEERDGQLIVPDTKLNIALMKHGRIFRSSVKKK